MVPSGSWPSCRARRSFIKISEDAPSVSGVELAAVTVPCLRSKAGFSLANCSRLESPRMLLSRSTHSLKGGMKARITSPSSLPAS
jgi:hypothetical protein